MTCSAHVTIHPCGYRPSIDTTVLRRAMAVLARAPNLRALDLTFIDHSYLGDCGAWAIGSLRNSPRLTAMSVIARYQNIGPLGASELAMLSSSPNLVSVTIELHGNVVRSQGAIALGSLTQSPSIRYLSLGLGANRVGDRAASALGAPNEGNPLQKLELDLDDNNLSDKGLSRLCKHRSLRDFKPTTLSPTTTVCLKIQQSMI